MPATRNPIERLWLQSMTQGSIKEGLRNRLFRVEAPHGARTVDADEPIRFGTAQAASASDATHGPRELLETFLDGALRHRLQPQALYGFLVAGM